MCMRVLGDSLTAALFQVSLQEIVAMCIFFYEIYRLMLA